VVACSPHVTTLRERIAVNGQPISEMEFDALIKVQEPVLMEARDEENGALSFFEVLTALAYKHYENQKVGAA